MKENYFPNNFSNNNRTLKTIEILSVLIGAGLFACNIFADVGGGVSFWNGICASAFVLTPLINEIVKYHSNNN